MVILVRNCQKTLKDCVRYLEVSSSFLSSNQVVELEYEAAGCAPLATFQNFCHHVMDPIALVLQPGTTRKRSRGQVAGPDTASQSLRPMSVCKGGC